MNQNILDQLKTLIEPDLQATNQLIVQELGSDVPLVQTIASYLVNNGGKRVRPLVLLLAANAMNIQGTTEHQELAVVIEFIHTATLLHDDVVDESTLRRGSATVNAEWGNQAAVLVGDFLYSRAFQIMAKRDNVPVMRVLANTTNALAEGEVLQLSMKSDEEPSELTYFEIIDRKTAKLFEAASLIGGMLATDDATAQDALRRYGFHLGMAFQIVDDLLDYTADEHTLGKHIGDDLAEGKYTLPLLRALDKGNQSQRQFILNLMKNPDASQLDQLKAILHETAALDYCRDIAQAHAEHGLLSVMKIPETPYREALEQLLGFVVERDM